MSGATSSPEVAEPARRFRVAFSYAGEKRAFVARVAELIAERFGEQAVLYDKFHVAEFARPDLGVRLPELYNKQSDLVVVVLCREYNEKDWTGLEWLAIHDLVKQRRHDEVMLCRFDGATAPGLYSAGFVELDETSPEEVARLILQRLALNEGFDRDHYLQQEVAPSPRPTHRRLRWFSTRESVAHGEITALAILETAVAISTLVGLALRFDSLRWLAGACCVAPMLLLRTEDSVQRGLRWLKAVDPENPRWAPVALIVGATTVAASFYLVGRWTLVIMGSLGAAPIWLILLTIRLSSTALSVLRHPVRSLVAIPDNWRRLVLATDSLTPPELLPGHPETPFSLLANWKNQPAIARWLSITAFIGSFPLATAYRWSVKATCVIYLPLIWLVNRARFVPGSIRLALEDYLADDIQRVRRVLAVVAIVAFVAKIAVLAHEPDVIGWANLHLPGWMLKLLHDWSPFLAPHQLPLWQITPALNGLIAFGLWLFARRVLRQKSKPISDATILAVWRTATTLGLALSLYAIACNLLITWRAGHLAETLRHWWALTGQRILP